MYSASIIYRKPGDPQKYITFVQLPGHDSEGHNEYFVKQVCMNYGVEYVSSQREDNPERRLSREEKERLGVVRKPYEFLTGKKAALADV